MRSYLTASIFASILLSASASPAQERPAAPPAGSPAPQPVPGAAPQPLPGAPQPLPAGAPQPLPGAAPPGYAPGMPPGYAPPPYYPYYYPPPGQMMVPPRVLKWNEGETIPPGYHKGSQIRKGLVIAGSVMFGVAWLPTAVVGSFADPLMIIPVAGPLVTAGRTDTRDGGGIVIFWLVFDSLQQAAGLAMLIAGVSARETVLLRSDVREAKPLFLPVPMTFGNRGGGLGLAGTL